MDSINGENVQHTQIMFMDIANFLGVLILTFHCLPSKMIWTFSCAQVTCETNFSPLRNIESKTEEID